ncbi:MAG: hypothetical protein KGI73_01190 [Patescibacteria group bacterium]|nr:hypothetical protein [Patescibacteria group bacterium]
MKHQLIALAVLVMALVVIGFGVSTFQVTPPSPGEGGVTASSSPMAGSPLVGVWQSTQDPNFTREFRADGTIVDAYAGQTPSSGQWFTFTKETAPSTDITYPVETGATYIRITDTENPPVVLDFKVTKLTSSALELIYLGRGNVLDFTRVR